MKIGLVRHGSTIYNALGKMQGKNNIPMSDEGRIGCQKLRQEIKDKNYDVCFSSPLIRSFETAMILVGDKIEIKVDDRLSERFIGNYEGKFYEEYDYSKYWDYELNFGDNGVEKLQDLFKRCNDFVNYLKENYDDKNILIVSHSAILQALYHIINESDLTKKLNNIKIDNCYYGEYEIKK